jgi:DHA2 family multidrug resistance protein
VSLRRPQAAGPTASAAAEPGKWIVTITVMLGTLMAALDMSIVNVALPQLRGSLGASVEEITWTATGYMLSNVCIMPAIGFFSARFGRKNFYLACIVLFTVASVLCGLAWNLSSMILFRVLQGIGGGALIPISQAIMRESFPPEEQGMAMGLYGLGVVMGPAFGPTLGGWLTDNLSWHWIFYINVPVGILNVLLVMRYIKDPHYLVRGKGKIDLAGLLLLIVSLSALLVVLEKGEREAWFESSLITSLTLTAAAGLALFVWRELAVDNPVVDLRILKNATFATGTFIAGILMVGLNGSLFLMPIFVQQTLGYPAMDAGLLLMPRSLAMAFSMPLAGRFYNRLGPRLLIGAGLLVTAFSFWQLSRLSLVVGYGDLFLPQVLQGAGFGMIFVALSTAALARVERPAITAATGLYNVIRTVFGSFGIAMAATLFTRGISSYRAVLVEHVSSYRDVSVAWERLLTGAMAARGADAVAAHERALKLLDGLVMRQASMLSFNYVYVVVTIIFVLSLPLVLLLKVPRHGGPADGEIAAE